MNRSDWVWMPHAAHLCCGERCRFHLATYVGQVIVSTVGELVLKYGQPFEEIGGDRLYETMVFPALPREDVVCCPWRIDAGFQLDMRGYNDPGDATLGHYALCEKYAELDNRGRKWDDKEDDE